MKPSDISRRHFVAQTISAAPILLATDEALVRAADPASTATRKLKVVCVGGHPDDPESGCGGTLKRYADAGHTVTIIYLTRGERGIPGKENAEAARIRSAECEAACKILGAKPVFAGQIDGSTEFNGIRLEEMKQLVASEKPNLIFAQWPIDTHIDHQAASLLTMRAWMALPRETRIYFYEVNGGSQTQGFFPNTYVDISAVVEKKKAALFAHASQDGEAIWRQHHEVMARWRGREAGVTMAEAFVLLSRNVQLATLPGA